MVDATQHIATILADDHAVARSGIAQTLRECFPIQFVAESGDGIALFAALAANHPDLLIADVMMPNFEPIDAICQIRASSLAMKELLLSTADRDVDVWSLLSAGVISGCYLKDNRLATCAWRCSAC